MRAFTSLNRDEAEDIGYILCDIDDTITTDGKLGANAYGAMWSLYEAGIHVIPITGRPAGWCDLIVRQWPVRAVVGENGAFAMYMDGGLLFTMNHPSIPEESCFQKLEALKIACLEGVPGCRVAKDQFSRKYDLAIDFNEDPPRLGFEAGEKIRKICLDLGAEAKLSSIHVNAWFGNYDKLGMTLIYLREIEGLDEDSAKKSVMFFGDSPNDEPMFSFFPNSCGVANITDFLYSMNDKPRFITEKKSGEGFAQAVEYLLSLR